MTKKKESNLGCFVYLAVVIAAFVFVPWPIALGFAIFLAIALVLVYAIGHEIKKIRRRNRTKKTMISVASEGYVELLAKTKPENEETVTWLKRAEADYSWISFQRFVGSRRSDNPGRWVSFYDIESEGKVLKVSDGSGECWVSLHMADFRIANHHERYKPIELLQALKDKPIAGFPLKELDEKDDIQVVERWIPKGSELYLFGYMSNLEDADQLIDGAKKAWRGGDHRNQDRMLTKDDFATLITKSSDSSSRNKILTPDYEVDPVEGVIVSLSGDSVVNRSSYAAIVAFSLGLIVLLGMGAGILYSEFPELFDKMLRWLTHERYT